VFAWGKVQRSGGEIALTYLESFERVWETGSPVPRLGS
jgi:hypothetical protein